MKIAVMSDAHGNLDGLRRCLKPIQAEHPDRLFFLGDAFGYGDCGEEVLNVLRRMGVQCLMGNHEAMLCGLLPLDPLKNQQYRLNPESLSADSLGFIKRLSPSLSLELDGRRLLFVHGRPDAPLDGYLYPDGDFLPLASLPYDAVFMGHTHRAFIRQAGSLLAVNPGTCGLPRQTGNRLSYALYDTATNACRLQDVDPGDILNCYTHADSRVTQYIRQHMNTEEAKR